MVAQPGSAPGWDDSGLFQHSGDFDWAESGQTLEQVSHPCSADDEVGLGLIQHRGNGLIAGGNCLEQLFAGGARGHRLAQRFLALFERQHGYCHRREFLSVPSAVGHARITTEPTEYRSATRPNVQIATPVAELLGSVSLGHDRIGVSLGGEVAVFDP
jgi:hypothetical protein